MYVIYKITNLKNGKLYIGQTSNYERRLSQYKSVSFNPNSKDYYRPIHNAIRKYGIKSFKFEIIKQFGKNVTQQEVDEQEIFFIKEYKSLVSEYGYNITQGGQGCRKEPLSYQEKIEKSTLFLPEEILELQHMLIQEEKTFSEIYEIFGERLKQSFLSNINIGINFYNPEFNYPLRRKARRKLSKNDIADIRERIKQGDVYADIAKDFSIASKSFLSQVNNGKLYYDSSETYPLCDKKISGWKNKQIVNKIIFDLINTNEAMLSIGNKYGRAKSTVVAINRGRNHRRQDLKYPLRDNQKENSTKII